MRIAKEERRRASPAHKAAVARLAQSNRDRLDAMQANPFDIVWRAQP
jgi:hypothetical protein